MVLVTHEVEDTKLESVWGQDSRGSGVRYRSGGRARYLFDTRGRAGLEDGSSDRMCDVTL